MVIGTNPMTILEVLASNNMNRFYTIPKYQREYTWGQKQWDTLFEDLVENEEGYFLGSIISVSKNPSGMNNFLEYEVIDGQQRLTTLSVLLMALYSKILPYKDSFDEETEMSVYLSLRKELVGTKGNADKTPRLTPQIQNNNRDDYLSLLTELKIVSGYEKKEKCGFRKIYKAFNRFTTHITDYLSKCKTEDKTLEDKSILFKLIQKVNSAILVSIDVNSNKDAYMLFESLNNRGVPLSAIDLIKNILISKAEKDAQADEIYDTWKRIIAYLSDDYNVQERFFRQYYNAFREELNKPFPVNNAKTKWALGAIATKSNLLDIYEKLIEKDYVKLLNKLETEASNYSILLNNSKENTPEDFRTPLLDLERIQGAPSYILLLKIISNRKEYELTDSNIVEIIKLLTKFFVRRNTTDNPPTRDLSRIFINLNQKIDKKTGQDVYNTIRQELLSFYKDDINNKYFENKLRGPIYIENTDLTRFLLCYYEDYYKTNEIYAGLWSRDEHNKYVWTIEHVFPEGDKIPQDWINMIANGDSNLAQKYHESYVHTLGNLTITGYNSNLSNLSFEKKKNRTAVKDGKKIDVGYKNGLKLNNEIVNQEKWTIDNITKRTDELVKFFLKVFEM